MCFMPRWHKLGKEGFPLIHWTEKQMVPTDTHQGVCRWPWQLFALGKADRPLWPLTDRWIPVNTWEWSAGMFCMCEIMQLFSVVYYVGTDLHKLDCRLVTNETTNKYRPAEKKAIQWQRLTHRRECKGLAQAVQANCILLNEGQQHPKKNGGKRRNGCPWSDSNNDSVSCRHWHCSDSYFSSIEMKGITGVRICVTNLHFSESLLHAVGQTAS